jgi:Tfp pilus assembly protein PilE
MSLGSNTDALVGKSDGFTLIELLVTMLSGMVVILALFTIMDVTLHQSTRTLSRLNALQRTRVKLEQVVNELHSACVSSGVQPILSGSTANQLNFISQYGNGASLTPVEHVITFNSSAGTLTDTTYAETGVTESSHPTYTFSSTAQSTTTLLTNVSQSGSTPVFQYFAYGAIPNGSGGYYQDPNGDTYEILQDGQTYVPGTTVSYTNDLVTSSSTTLTTTNAPTVAEVRITLYGGPTVGATGIESGTSGLSQGADSYLTVQDSVVLRLTDPANDNASNPYFGPCE